MKSIYETFKKSVYNPSFYQSAPTESFGAILGYYSKVALILSAAMTIVLGAVLIPIGVKFVKERAGDLVRTYYPADLVVHIEKGEATANVPMPYIIPVKQLTGVTPAADVLQNMVVIDTAHDFEKKTFEDYKTYTLLTKSEIVTQSDNGQITIQNLRGMPTSTMSQEVLLSWIENIKSSLWIIVLVGIVATFIIFTCGYLLYLIPLILFAFVPFFVAWLKKTPLSYGASYKMSMYAIIPALALKTALNLLGVFFLPPYFTLLVFMLVITINMREVDQPKLFN